MNGIHIPRVLLALMLVGSFSTTHTTFAANNSSAINNTTVGDANDSTQHLSDAEKDRIAAIIEPPNVPIEKNFDKVRAYESYDPITDTWSSIDGFKTVEILDDTTQHRDENYIYRSFWAYDAKQQKWKRVDIRDYGYKYGIHMPPSNADTADAVSKEKSTFWKNLGLTLSTGGGGTYYINTANNLDLIVRKNRREFLLQSQNLSDQLQGKAYQIRWFNNNYVKISGIRKDGVVHDENSFDEIKGSDANPIKFEGIGFNIPIMIGLHYTFFKKLRVGAGGNLEINYLKTLTVNLRSAAGATYELENPWFYNLKWFGTIGYKVFQRAQHAVVIDTQLGIVYDLGGEPIKNLRSIINLGLYGSLGVAHERRLNNYFTFFYRLSGDFKQYTNTSEFELTKASVDLLQPAIHLEAGLILNFGRDTDSEEDDAEPSSDGTLQQAKRPTKN